MASFEVKRRDAKTGNKREKDVRKLSQTEMRNGQWARATNGAVHHFFIAGTSVCGRQQPAKAVTDVTRKLCPDCFTAVARAAGHSGPDGS